MSKSMCNGNHIYRTVKWVSKYITQVKVKCKGKASGQAKSTRRPKLMMQAGGGAFQKCAFLICSLSSCLVHFFSLFQLSQVRPMWWWLCELSTWLVFTFWDPHTCLWMEPTLTSLTLTKGYLQVGPSSYKRWFGLLCARLWEKLISSFMPFFYF